MKQTKSSIMGIQYDNSAFYYFMGTMLQFYLLPATWYNIKQFYLFLEARANVGKDLGKGRTAAERKKFERIREERRKCNNLFTSCFTVQFIILILYSINLTFTVICYSTIVLIINDNASVLSTLMFNSSAL